MTDAVTPVVTPVKKPRKKNIKPPAGDHTIVFPEDIDMGKMWVYEGKPLTVIPDKVIGFVYCITNHLTGKKYIGKKNFFGLKTRSVKKQKVRERVQSDFITYYGSNDALKADVATHGAEHFTREILLLCESKGQMGYYEAKYQLAYDVIGKPDQWYNQWVMVRTTSAHLKPHHYNHILRTDL